MVSGNRLSSPHGSTHDSRTRTGRYRSPVSTFVFDPEVVPACPETSVIAVGCTVMRLRAAARLRGSHPHQGLEEPPIRHPLQRAAGLRPGTPGRNVLSNTRVPYRV